MTAPHILISLCRDAKDIRLAPDSNPKSGRIEVTCALRVGNSDLLIIMGGDRGGGRSSRCAKEIA